MTRIFVYGTLKSGFHNHYLLEDSEKRESGFAEGIELHQGPGFPFAKKGQGVTHGEVYYVDDKTLMQVDQLEGYPGWYEREEIMAQLYNGDEHQAYIYLNPEADNFPIIKDGVWS